MAQAKPASPPPQPAAGIRVSPNKSRAATYEEATAPSLDGAAGVTSSQRQVTPATFFERPVTARAPVATPAWAAEPETPPAPPSSMTPHRVVWDATGSAGLHTTQRPPSQHGWIEQTRPGTARESHTERTEQRVFAPLPSGDGDGPAGNRARSGAQREARRNVGNTARLPSLSPHQANMAETGRT